MLQLRLGFRQTVKVGVLSVLLLMVAVHAHA